VNAAKLGKSLPVIGKGLRANPEAKPSDRSRQAGSGQGVGEMQFILPAGNVTACKIATRRHRLADATPMPTSSPPNSIGYDGSSC